jgi:hypothetical protein
MTSFDHLPDIGLFPTEPASLLFTSLQFVQDCSGVSAPKHVREYVIVSQIFVRTYFESKAKHILIGPRKT